MTVRLHDRVEGRERASGRPVAVMAVVNRPFGLGRGHDRPQIDGLDALLREAFDKKVIFGPSARGLRPIRQIVLVDGRRRSGAKRPGSGFPAA